MHSSLEQSTALSSGTGDVVVLPSVVELASACGSPPFAALPNLVTVEQYDWLSMDAFASMACHCKGLRELKVLGGHPNIRPWPNGSFKHAAGQCAKSCAYRCLDGTFGSDRPYML